MSESVIESHPFPPLLPPQATVMMMGTFPPPADKRSMAFHYPNFQNDMWRIYGAIFFDNKDHFVVKNEKRFDAERIKAFLTERGIASCPTVLKAIRARGNASDKFLDIVEPVPLAEILTRLPQCKWIFTTGGKATEVLCSLSPEKPKEPKTNEAIDFPFAGRKLKLYRAPSTSRAYPLSFEKKTAAYRTFFQLAGIL
ncbi:DNA glycosylase [Bisgaard Taxon 10/6]|uniref:DNA glycosylase n=1 Tax=Exercitatus varius TaxID=67857 RepID=UPI00294B66CD|nr:DNA glycosylase [Exercitatus varius]MDG2914750.1 DNA glycosylase [Exercitatus varius]MDG2917816.1 DNA glycosylase [Exercitatus varius]MDG2942449.1 DNA glycosylase [Exercitatus varius]MDG2944275.1 DNA glycosylase [Exercitatus varius]MDG2952628.1 DNA glycosylase [Exercitatus varius]